MTSAIKLTKILNPSKLTNNTHLYNVIRAKHVALWNKIWQPGKKPVTEEERLKAAEKYGLHPSEYQPYEDSLGDYPKIPKLGAESEDPTYPYDYPVFRRNFGDPVQAQYHNLTLDRFSPAYDHGVSPLQAFSGFFGTVLGFCLLTWLCDDYPCFQPVTEKQYPYQGVTHYTFEPAK